MHLSFKSVCNKENKGVICYMTSSSNSSQSTRPTGRVLWKELIVLSRFQSYSEIQCKKKDILMLEVLSVEFGLDQV